MSAPDNTTPPAKTGRRKSNVAAALAGGGLGKAPAGETEEERVAREAAEERERIAQETREREEREAEERRATEERERVARETRERVARETREREEREAEERRAAEERDRVAAAAPAAAGGAGSPAAPAPERRGPGRPKTLEGARRGRSFRASDTEYNAVYDTLEALFSKLPASQARRIEPSAIVRACLRIGRQHPDLVLKEIQEHNDFT